ncbi:unnamed protein product [Caenorhabditis brenneri]
MVRTVISNNDKKSRNIKKIRLQLKPVKARIPLHEQEKVLRAIELLKKEEQSKIRQKIDQELQLHFEKLSKQYFASGDFEQLINPSPYWSTLCKSQQDMYREKFAINPECPTIPTRVQRFLIGEKEVEKEMRRRVLTNKLEALSATEHWRLVEKYRRHSGSVQEFVENTMELNIPTLVIEEFFRQEGGNHPTRAVLAPVPLSMEL